MENNQTQPLVYHPIQQTLAVPTVNRLPTLYERVLVLASGLLPHRPDANWLTYTAISEPLAQLLAQKLKLTIEAQTEEQTETS